MNQNEITLREFLNLKFENLGKDVARLDGRYQEFERKNCSKHQEIIKQLAEYKGEMGSTLEKLAAKSTTKEQYTDFFKIYKEQVSKYDCAIEERKQQILELHTRVDVVEKAQQKLMIYFSIIVSILYVILNFGIDFLKASFIK